MEVYCERTDNSCNRRFILKIDYNIYSYVCLDDGCELSTYINRNICRKDKCEHEIPNEIMELAYKRLEELTEIYKEIQCNIGLLVDEKPISPSFGSMLYNLWARFVHREPNNLPIKYMVNLEKETIEESETGANRNERSLIYSDENNNQVKINRRGICNVSIDVPSVGVSIGFIGLDESLLKIDNQAIINILKSCVDIFNINNKKLSGNHIKSAMN